MPSGYADGLAAAMLDAVLKRDELVARMLAGIAFARARTLDLACRQRFARAMNLKGDRTRGVA